MTQLDTILVHTRNRISTGRDACIRMLNSGTRRNSQAIKAAEMLSYSAVAKDNVETPPGSHIRSEVMSSSGKPGGK